MPRAPSDTVLRRVAHARDMRIEYTLTASRVGGVTFYGVTVAMTSGGGFECAELCELTGDRALAVAVLDALARGSVTPCAAAGVAEDMVAEAAMRSTLRAVKSRLCRG